MLKYKFLIFFLPLLVLSSCFKKEDPIKLPNGVSEIKTIFLGDNYEYEMYFELSSGSYQQKQRQEWDLRFETDDNGWGIFVNTGNNVKVRRIDLHHLNEPKCFDTNYIKSKEVLKESPDGKPENSSFKDWRTYKTGSGASTIYGIYIIELPHLSGSKRFKRMQFESVDDTIYTCVITDLFDAAGDSILFNNSKTTIRKNKNQNYTYLSFKGGYTHIVNDQEPNKNSWDFVFSRYTHLFPNILSNGELFPYNVSGVLISKNKVKVAKDSLTPFNDINLSSIGKYTFMDEANIIGYDWKSHSFSATGTYTVNSNYVYIIKDTKGRIYKLRFLDFYNSKGEKGYPKFEYELIL
jgi:hypothetical protein